jgi:hypothetical protein
MQNASLEAFLYLEGVPTEIPLDASHYEWRQHVDHRGRPRSKVRAGTWSFATSQLDQTSYEHLLELMLSPYTVVDARAVYGRADGQGTFVTVWGRQCSVCHVYSHFDARGTTGRKPGWTLYFSLAPQEMGREGGTAGSFVMPAARSYAYTPPITGSSDWMAAERADPWEGKKQSGKAYLGSPPLKRKQLQQLRELAQQQYATNIQVLQEGNSLLEKMRLGGFRAAFQASSKTVFLQPQATYFEVRHELYHAEHCAALGISAYTKQTRAEKETYVYHKMIGESHNLTPTEIKAATNYINRVRTDEGLTPL